MILTALQPYALAISLAAGSAALAGSAWIGYRSGASHVQARWDAAVVANQAGQAAALKAAAEAIAKIEVKSERIIQPVRTEIRTNTVYRECRHSDDSLRNLNALITGSELPASAGVPGTHSAP